MQVYYSDTFEFPVPEGHHFPMEKYRLARNALAGSEFANRLDFHAAPAASDEQLLLVHTEAYLQKLQDGNLTRMEQRRIGFPWSSEMIERHRRSTGATIAAARVALNERGAVHLAGGTHHAFPERGEGFCVFNDVAVAIRVLQNEGSIRRATVVDLDVHQGNGTAAIFAEDTSVFTFSMHGERNFPPSKTGSDLDVQLPDGTSDEDYLSQLEQSLTNGVPISTADIVFYIAGADCYESDRYGRLRLSKQGLVKRDQRVFEQCFKFSVPISVVMGGGYSSDVNDIVEINFNTVIELLKLVHTTNGHHPPRSP